MRRFLFLLLLSILSSCPAAAAGLSEEADFFDLERSSLEEILNIRTTVATRSTVPLREAPGLVAVITRKEIQDSGARNLIDVLSQLPEFEFGADVQGNLGLGVRGNWANEGKVLLLWDGQVYNESLYSTLQFDRFPVDQIEEIEIIKGPGSVIYGGFAELAVINIKTRPAASLRGSEVYGALGAGGSAARYAGYSFGRVFRSGEISAKAFAGTARRSGRRYTDAAGSSYGMAGNSDLRPRNLNLQAAYGNTSARLILDGFSLDERDHYTTLLSTGATRIAFPAVFGEIKQSLELPGQVRVEPRISYMRSRAWYEDDEHFPYDKRVGRLTAGLTAFYKSSSRTDFLAGGEYFHDDAEVGALTGTASSYPDGRTSVHYDNHALFAQGSFGFDFGRIVAGARYDNHSHYGASLVPRLAVTRLVNDFNFKAIYSRAFRAPSIENIRLNPEIDPEKTEAVELEAGYKASPELFASASLFHTAIEDPIIFNVTGGSETYSNYSRTGTCGAGFGLKFKRDALRADAAYLYTHAGINRVDVYSVPGRGGYMLGFPRHKLTLSASVPLAAGLSANPSAVYVSRRYGYGAGGALKAYGDKVIAALNFRLEDRPLRGLSLNLGVRDIFGSGYSYIQPYSGGHAPLPSAGREFFLKAGYAF